jgi:hypothetical protein
MNIRTLAVYLLLAFVSAMAFAQSETYRVKPLVYDPGATGTIVSQWVKHLGLQDPGETDNENWGMLLSKNTANSTNAAAFGQIVFACCGGNLNIKPLIELGFDIRNGGHCGAGSPRFNVITSDKVNHFVGGCANDPAPTPIAPGWQRVRFDPANPAQAFPPVSPTDLVIKIYIVADEGVDAGPDFSGVSIVDNIDLNGDLIGEPN